jgi:predicted GIY-YIG superfamily endonuclease
MPWRGSNGFNFSQTSVDANAPAASGVYALFNEGQWIYFGESGNIRDRLTQHINNNETNPCVRRSAPRLFAYELVPAALRVARQNELIREFWHQGLCNQKLG